MGLPQQQQFSSQDNVDYATYLQSSHNRKVHINQSDLQYQLVNNQKHDIKDHNTSFTTTKGLLNGPGQNNCFLNSAVQFSVFSLFGVKNNGDGQESLLTTSQWSLLYGSLKYKLQDMAQISYTKVLRWRQIQR
ncbi:hypothetical protein PV325_003106 [Microctonus aethiopoides]|nr:hypothetical protein PV325_003106 [Microctonus aethiopoides]